MDEKGWPDMGHRLSSLSSQCAAQYPHQQSQQEIDGSNKKVEGVFVDESIKGVSIPTLPVRVLLFAKVA